MQETARTICRWCREDVTAAKPEAGPPWIGKAVHAATGEELGADGVHVAAPIDPAILTSAPKPTVAGLGIDVAALERGDWVLMRVAGGGAGRVSVFDRNEWECFLDGARNGEFDGALT